jgi:DNA-binding NtrC family response regulator
VLLVGESGTGKNLLALAMHNENPLRAGKFVELNVGAIPDELAESELFGHEKGAFTGAQDGRPGVLEDAHHGTLFLDEVGNMSAALQRKLLTAVERRTFRRVGGNEERRVELRLISATNADLREEAARGSFREDLYYRLCRLVIRVPPLRERPKDILPLARGFLESANQAYGRCVERLSAQAEVEIVAYSWPGNVRQLRNAIACAVAMSRGAELGWTDIRRWLEPSRDPSPPGAGSPARQGPPLEASLALVERWHMERVLEHVGGNKAQAAQILGVSRRGLYDKLRRHGLEAAGGGDE